MLHDINLFRISKAVDLFCPENVLLVRYYQAQKYPKHNLYR